MDIVEEGRVVGKVALAMKSVGPCENCGAERHQMYAVFRKNKPPIASTCSECMHKGGMFLGIVTAYKNARKKELDKERNLASRKMVN